MLRARRGGGALGFVAATLVAAAVLFSPLSAGANGAFPDSLQILLPSDRPQQIALSTNFGLIISDDGGASWTWTCEQQETIEGSLYAVGAAPDDRFYGLGGSMIAYSDDVTCSWKLSQPRDITYMRDYFPDPVDPKRVLAIGNPINQGYALAPQLFASKNGGTTFGDPLYTAPEGGALTGVESARSAPDTIYLALTTGDTHPKLVRTTDGGATWTTFDVEPALGPGSFRIIEVDPADARTLYVRFIAADGDSLAVSHDGGETFTRLVKLANGTLKAFAHLPSGTILAAGRVGGNPIGFRSKDGGATFAAWDGVPRLSALAVRDGKLYGAASNFEDHWAIGVSADEGATFTPLGSYASVTKIRECAQKTCSGSCETQAKRGVWSADVCGLPPAPAPSASVQPPTPDASSSGCRIAGNANASFASLALAALCFLRRRSRRRPL
jgi:hypothetical protein